MADLKLTPPYIAVIFTSHLKAGAIEDGYDETAVRMVELAKGQPGYLGIETARGPDGLGITISYWRDEAAIAAWRQHPEHLKAIEKGKSDWYESYQLRIARVE